MADETDPFLKATIPLPAGHGWTCKPGNNLFVADRGAVAFEIPATWVIRHEKHDILTMHDQPPPDDVARLSLTIFPLPPVKGGWGQLPLDKMLSGFYEHEQRSRKKKHPPRPLPAVERVPRADLEMVWTERPGSKDPQNGKKIRCRQILARARLVQCLITFDVYEDAAERFQSVWNNLISSLQLAVPRDLMGHVGN
jgi:hypothetical protein